MLVTGTAAVTVTTQSSFDAPACAVIVAVPSFIAVTVPSLATIAISVLLLTHVTFSSWAVVGVIVAVNCAVLPATRLKVFESNVMPTTLVTFTSNFTFLVVSAFVVPLSGSSVEIFPATVAVIIVSPTFFAITKPLESTDAILSSLLTHDVTVSPVVLSRSWTLSSFVAPTFNVTDISPSTAAAGIIIRDRSMARVNISALTRCNKFCFIVGTP